MSKQDLPKDRIDEFPEESNESPEELSQDMDLGKKEEDVYSKVGREKLLEDGEISAAEEGFMQGESAGGKSSKCMNCGKILDADHPEEIIEKEIEGKLCWFCSDKCAEKKSK